MRLNPGLLMFAILAAATLVAAVLLASTAPGKPPKPCEGASSSLEHHFVAEAQKQYAAILAKSPASGCATAGMRRVLEDECQRADMMRIGAAPEEARRAYAAILKVDFTYTAQGVGCAIRGLALLDERPAGLCPCRGTTGERGPQGPRGPRGYRGPPGRVVYAHGCKPKWCGRG
jgi:hypothetical protein